MLLNNDSNLYNYSKSLKKINQFKWFELRRLTFS